MKYLVTVWCLVLLSGVADSQVMVKGNVMDRQSREPLELVVLTDSATGKHTMTDKAGNFRLLGLVSDTATLSASLFCYQTQRVRLFTGNVALVQFRLERGPVDLRQVTITSSPGGTVGAFHTLCKIDLNLQPVRSAQDLLRLVPGLLIAQHQGGGKAEQIFLRGFDADHGTDVNISLDGMPVNMVSHAHGQGYADMHFIIPETIAGYDFGKGVYYTDKGDFTTAGFVSYRTINALDHSMVKVETGQYHNIRVAGLFNLLSPGARNRGRTAYVAAEGLYFDGPFGYPEHFNRGNLFGKFITPLGLPSQPGRNSKLTIEVSTLSSPWRASGEIPNRAIAEGYLKDRFGVIDSAQGGNTTRTNAIIRLGTQLNSALAMENMAWYSHYYFNLISNFTFYYYYPGKGDEFRQHEKRNQFGYTGKLSDKFRLGTASLNSNASWGYRDDDVAPSFVAHSLQGDVILNYINLGKIRESTTYGYFEETLQQGNWLINAGVRMDYLHFYFDNQAPLADTSASIYLGKDPRVGRAVVCPKLNVQYTFGPALQFYLKLGKGFHSNDAHVVIANDGVQVLPAAYGAEIGANWKPLPRLFVNTAFWYLYLQQEFTFSQDLGDQEVSPGGKTRREGIDFSARFQVLDWLFANVNVDLARPRAVGGLKGQQYLPLAPTFTSTGALDFHFANGWNGGTSYRYLHNRPADAGNHFPALGYFITDLAVNYTRKKYEIGLAIENVLNQQWNESQFEYVSRLKNELAPVTDVSYTPGTPFFAKLKLAVFF